MRLDYKDFDRPTLQCKINGQVVTYDACSTNTDLEDAKKFYQNFTYIGSGNGVIINGVYIDENTLYHFFKRNYKTETV